MKNLKTLIKLHKNYVDTTLREIARFNGAKELMEKRIVVLIEEMKAEATKFSSTEYGFVLDQYLTNARIARDKLKENIANLDKKILESQIILHNQFAELKKFEIALQNREKAIIEARDAAEVKELDELNIIRYA